LLGGGIASRGLSSAVREESGVGGGVGGVCRGYLGIGGRWCRGRAIGAGEEGVGQEVAGPKAVSRQGGGGTGGVLGRSKGACTRQRRRLGDEAQGPVRLRPVGLARALPTCLFQNAGPESEVLQWRPHGNLFRCRAASPWWFGNWRWRVRPFWGRAARRRLCLVPNFGLWQLTVAGPGNRGCCQSKLPAARRQSGVRVPNNSHQKPTRSSDQQQTAQTRKQWRYHRASRKARVTQHQPHLGNHVVMAQYSPRPSPPSPPSPPSAGHLSRCDGTADNKRLNV
jgi:hypothetical protein